MLTKTLAPWMLSVCVTVAATTAALPVGAQNQKSLPKSKEVIQLAQKALGGASFFTPKPHSYTYTAYLNDPGAENKTIQFNASYKGRKYYSDCTTLIQGKEPSNFKTIVDLDNSTAWGSFNGGKYSKISDYRKPEMPCFGKQTMDNLLFSETPAVVKQNGVDYYKMDAKYGEARYEDYRVTYLIDAKTNLIYKVEVINTKYPSYKSVKTYTDYIRVSDIMVPQKRIIEETDFNGSKFVEEGTISNFKFRNDLPDKLFVVPK